VTDSGRVGSISILRSTRLMIDWDEVVNFPSLSLRRIDHSATIRHMTSDPLEHLLVLLQESQDPDQALPRFISEPRDAPDKIDERGWLAVLRKTKVQCRKGASHSWQIVIEWFDSWFRTVLTGAGIGAVIGFFYRWFLLPS
jgi:hypothetical protein